MQTSAIPYRVADFLKEHPPFQFLDEADLLALAAHGRVKFHEADEYICWQASPHTPFIYVIQQGSVLLWDESTDPPTLRDIRGAGDTIGIERFNGSLTNAHSVKSASDVVLYALLAEDLEPLLAAHPQAAQYIAAYSTVTTDYEAAGDRTQPHELFLADLLNDHAPVRCSASTPIHEAACLLKEAGVEALALTSGQDIVALLTAVDLLHWVAAGAVNPSDPAQSIASASFLAVAPQTSVSACILAMAESSANAAAVTRDGSQNASLQGIVTASTLTPAFGDHPLTIVQQITCAPTVRALRALHERARHWILENLALASIDWLADFAGLINHRIVERLIQLSGNHRPDRLLCFYGAAGRQELLTKVAPCVAVIGEEIPALQDQLSECGYLPSEPPAFASVSEWKSRYSGWIRDPIQTESYLAHAFFDLRRVSGPAPLFDELQSHIRRELASEPAFLHVLAHDCLSNLPPLTFFLDLVIEESGEESATFRLEVSALKPLVEVARVFSLASGNPLGASTRLRFEAARRLLPVEEAIFREAAETTRVVLFHQTRAGLRLRSSGAELPLSRLSRQDRQVLKSGFRSIQNLLQLVQRRDWLEAL